MDSEAVGYQKQVQVEQGFCSLLINLFYQSDFYAPLQTIINGKRTASLVADTDEVHHAAARKSIASAYSLSTLIEYEPLVDTTTEALFRELDQRFAEHGQVCDLGKWIQYWAFDVMGEMTFSKRLGFLDTGQDVEGIIETIGRNFDWAALMGQMPLLDDLLMKNPIYLRIFAKPIANPVTRFGQKRFLERLDEVANQSSEATEPGRKTSRPDFLSRFLSLRNSKAGGSGGIETDQQILAYLFANVNAGSDTVAATLRAVIYYLLRNPSTLERLLNELSSAKLTLPFPTWTETKDLPYLNAVIKEALRIFPVFGLVLERVVPPSGLTLPDNNSTFIPSDTIIGVNPWVLHRDARIFGEDAKEWRPERWLVPSPNNKSSISGEPSASEERIKRMDRHILSFGAGARVCLGRNIAMLEMHKLLPALLMRYEVKLARPEREWRIRNGWLVRQEGLDVLLERKG